MVDMNNAAAQTLPAVCQTCERAPKACRCKNPGALVAPKGVIVAITFGRTADRDEARAIVREFFDAKDARSEALYGTPTGRRRPDWSSAVVAWSLRFAAACRALDALQARCSHRVVARMGIGGDAPAICSDCGAHVERN